MSSSQTSSLDFVLAEATSQKQRETEPKSNRQIVRELFSLYHPTLLRFLMRRLRSETDAADVAQEAYLRLLELKRLNTIIALQAYLFRTASNIAIDRLRKQIHSDVTKGHLEYLQKIWVSPSLERILLGEQQLTIVKTTLKELPWKCRVVCTLNFFAELTVTDIAKLMELSQRMVRYYLARGLAACREALDNADKQGERTRVGFL